MNGKIICVSNEIQPEIVWCCHGLGVPLHCQPVMENKLENKSSKIIYYRWCEKKIHGNNNLIV